MDHPFHRPLFEFEMIGTVLLLSSGLSLVIALFGAGRPAAGHIPNWGISRAIAGFQFGSISGAHLSPADPGFHWAGLITGAQLAALACSFLAKRIEVAKMYGFDGDHERLVHRIAAPNSQ